MSLETLGGLFTATGRKNTSADAIKQPPQRVDRHLNHLLDLPKRDGYGIERVKITTELAQHYLSFNRTNRAIIQKRVDTYADEMMRGEWIENGESIKFTKSHRLADGQHRLLALVKAGVSLYMIVAFGVEDEAMTKIDIGKVRTASDVLAINGMGRWESLIAGAASHAIINVSHGLPVSSNVKRLNREIEEFYLEFPAFQKSVQFVAELPRKVTPITHTRALVLHYLFSLKDVAAADAFMMKLFTGESLARSNPIYQLREKLNEAQRAGARSYNAREQFHACIKAWNCIRTSKTISARSLFPRSDEAIPEIV